jgi:hypothetical protein
VTDPEEVLGVDHSDLVERAVHVVGERDRVLPIEADEADAIDQSRDVPDAGEDEYPG